MKKYLIVFVLVIVGLAFYSYFNKQNTDNTQIYSNSQFDFQINLPASWTGYKVIDRGRLGENVLRNQLDFYLPTDNENWNKINDVKGFASVFSLEVYSIPEWEKLKQRCGQPGGDNWAPGCVTDGSAILRNNEIAISVVWPNSGPDVSGDARWGELRKEVSKEYLINNISVK